jgi:hypothetical protein
MMAAGSALRSRPIPAPPYVAFGIFGIFPNAHLATSCLAPATPRSKTALVVAQDVEVKPVLDFLEAAVACALLDEMVHTKLPRLTATLLMLTAHVISTIAPSSAPLDERPDRLMRGARCARRCKQAVHTLDLTL